MDRDKLLERVRKLLAMSQDSSSPAEAAIAERRLKALMSEHQITFEEIKGPQRDSSTPPRTEERRRTSVRTKRSRSRVRSKRTQSRSRWFRGTAFIAVCGIALALGVWMIFNSNEEILFNNTASLESHQNQAIPRYITPTLTTKVERVSVIEGESIVLYITGSGLSAPPDTSGLLSSFRIVNTNATNMTRDKDSVSFQIRLELQPREAGILFIPSFFVDGIKSDQIIIDVVR